MTMKSSKNGAQKLRNMWHNMGSIYGEDGNENGSEVKAYTLQYL